MAEYRSDDRSDDIDIDHDEGCWRKSDDMRVPKAFAIEKAAALGKSSNKPVTAIEALNIEGNTVLKDKITIHLNLKKGEKQSNTKLKNIISYELSKTPTEFKEIAKEVIESYNKQHTLKVFGEEEK